MLPSVTSIGTRPTFDDDARLVEIHILDYDADLYGETLTAHFVKFLRSPDAGRYGALISIVGGRLHPLPFDTMLNPGTGRMLPRRVDVDSEAYECARRYMIRLERQDFEDPGQLAKLANAAGVTPEQFRERFGYLAGLTE